jgi:hypothetical protein
MVLEHPGDRLGRRTDHHVRIRGLHHECVADGRSVRAYLVPHDHHAVRGERVNAPVRGARHLRTGATILAWACTGWLIGAGFYRFGTWGGIAFILPASIPAAVTEIAFNASPALRSGAEGGALAVDAAVAAAAIAAGLLGAFLVVRTIAINTIPGSG